MSIVVLLRAVHDPELASGVTGSSYRLDEGSSDAIVLALAARRAGAGSRAVGFALGPGEWDAAIRDALALGLDEVLRVWGPGAAKADIPGHARALVAALPPDTEVVVAGGAAADHGAGLLPFALAELLGWPTIEQVAGVAQEDGRPVIHVRASGGRRRTCSLGPQSVLVATHGGPAPYPTVARKVAARRTGVPVLTPTVGMAEPTLAFQGYGPARPITRHLLQPSTSANAAGRLRQLMSGGASTTNDSRTLAGSGLASQLAELLHKEGFVP